MATSGARAAQPPGSLDTGYGNDGVVLTGFAPAPVNGYLQDMEMDPDGSALVFGSASDRFALARFRSDGNIETSYGHEGFATDGIVRGGKFFNPFRTAVQSDGKVVAIGSTGIFQSKGLMVRFNADGSIDRTFGTRGVVILPLEGREVEVDSQDRLVVAAGPGFKTRFFRYSRNGQLDGSFGDNGSVTVDFSGTSGYSGMSVVGNRITLTSPFEGVLRLTANGGIDTAFSGDGIYQAEVRAMAVQPDGKVVIANGYGDVTRLLADGTPDAGFGSAGTSTVSAGANNTVTLDSAGRILVGGITLYTGDTSPRDFEVFRLTPEGQLDESFGGDGIVTTDLAPFEDSPSGSEDTIRSISALPDGRVLVAGDSRHNIGIQSWALVRYTNSGELDNSFGAGTGVVIQRPMLPSDDRAFDAFARPGGSVTAIGKSGVSTALAKYDPKGNLDLNYGDAGKVSTRLTTAPLGEMAESGAALTVGEKLVCSSSGQGSSVARFDANGDLDESFGNSGVVKLPSLRRCYSTLDSPGGIILGGIDSENVVRIARLGSSGDLDTSYGEGGYVTGPDLSPSGGGLRRADFDLAPNGDLVMAGDRFGATVARFTDQGKPRRSFGTNGVMRLDGFHSSSVVLSRANSVDVTSRGRIVIGGVADGDATIVKLKADGKPVRSFGKNGIAARTVLKGSSIEDIRVQSNGTIVAAGATHASCEIANRSCYDRVLILRYRPNGKPDPGFGNKGQVVRQFGIRSKASKVLIGPRFITIAGYAETALDRQQFLIARFWR